MAADAREVAQTYLAGLARRGTAAEPVAAGVWHVG